MITVEELKKCLSYNPDTGVFTWLASRKGVRAAGVTAGHKEVSGYVSITVNGLRCRAHQLAWVYGYGVWPRGYIDHINGDPSDNRLSNLRLATPSQNQANRRRSVSNRAGLKGVSFFKPAKRWYAQITVNRRNIHLGYFDDPQEAHAAYCQAAEKYFGEFARFA